MPTIPSFLTQGSPDAVHPHAVHSVVLPHWIDPVDAFDRLYSGSTYAVWLDAGAGATTGMSYLAAAHGGSRLVTASARAGTVTCTRPLRDAESPVTTRGTIFDFLRAELPRTAPSASASASGDRKSTRLNSSHWE